MKQDFSQFKELPAPLPVGERVIISSPGGGGIGDPFTRERALVETDLANGLISQDAARKLYGLDAARLEPQLVEAAK